MFRSQLLSNVHRADQSGLEVNVGLSVFGKLQTKKAGLNYESSIYNNNRRILIETLGYKYEGLHHFPFCQSLYAKNGPDQYFMLAAAHMTVCNVKGVDISNSS